MLEDQQRADGRHQRRGSRKNSDQYERFDQRELPTVGESFLDGFGKQDIKMIAARERAERAYQNALPQPHVRAHCRCRPPASPFAPYW